MCLSSVTIVIEFAAGPWARQSEPPALFGRLIRLVESGTGAERAFTFVDGTRPVYTLTAGEMDELLRLLGQMAARAPWEAAAGFDGCTYTLLLTGPMSEISFSWWVEVPKGWESIGAVAGYVMRLADRCGLS
jgi:hypothetical protein